MNQPAPPAPPACPACESSDWRELFEKKGRAFWRCRGCGLDRQHPLPTIDELAAYYDRSYTDGMYRDFTAAEPMKRLTARARLAQLKRHAGVGAWLDVGCSDGVFLDELAATGAHGEGVELSGVAAELARRRGLSVFNGPIEDYVAERPFANVTAFDVLEHVLDPVDFLGHARRVLEPGGRVAITVPNVGSLPCRLMGKRWYLYIPEEHLHLFTRQAMRRLLERCGFEQVRAWSTYKPLTFDYSLVQFEEYNPLIHRVLKPLSWVTPKRLRQTAVPLYIGELLVTARRRED